MLQYITYNADARTMVDQAVKAIDGGARWVELRADGVTPGDRREAIRLAAEELSPLCRGKNIFLILHDEPDLALELECNGVHLEPQGMAPREAREKLGAGAVIGVTVNSPMDAAKLSRLDIDYLRVRVSSPEELRPYAEALAGAESKMALVAEADITPDNAAAYLAAGAAGLATSAPIATAADPVLATAALLNAL